jgi:hypothetical protein
MGWAEDKKRIAELGPSLTSLCAVLVALAVLGVWNTFMVWRLGADFIGQYGEEVRSIVFAKTAWTALSPLLLLVSACALFFSSARAAPVFAILAIVYVAFGSLSLIMSTLTNSAWRPLNFWDAFDAAVAVAIVSFLLVSKDVQRVYGTSTRKFLTHDIVNLWRKARSRPTLEETEAVRLQDTFK